MLEFLKHSLGICGEHWHPNLWTFLISTPIIGPIFYYIKHKCGFWFNRKDKNQAE